MWRLQWLQREHRQGKYVTWVSKVWCDVSDPCHEVGNVRSRRFTVIPCWGEGGSLCHAGNRSVMQETEVFVINCWENIYKNSDEPLQRCLGSAVMLLIIHEKVIPEILRQKQKLWETNPQAERYFPTITAVLTLDRLWNTHIVYL